MSQWFVETHDCCSDLAMMFSSVGSVPTFLRAVPFCIVSKIAWIVLVFVVIRCKILISVSSSVDCAMATVSLTML